MTSLKSFARWTSLSLLLVSAAGCESSIPVYPVRGKVTFEGKPMAGGGSITLFPLTDQPGMAPGGDIAPDGTYSLSTNRPGDGSMVGEFRVTISQITEREPPKTADGEKPAAPVAAVPQAERIPAIYSDASKSPLRATVEAKSVNEIDFELKR